MHFYKDGHGVIPSGWQTVQLPLRLLPQCMMDSDTDQPLDTLTSQAQHQIHTLGSHNTRVSDIIAQKDPAVFTAIQEGLDRANEHAPSRAQEVGILCIANLFKLPSCRV